MSDSQLNSGNSIACELPVPWRFVEGVKSYIGFVSEDAVLPVGWGLGRVKKEDEGPINCGSVNL